MEIRLNSASVAVEVEVEVEAELGKMNFWGHPILHLSKDINERRAKVFS